MNKAQMTLWTNQALPATGTVVSNPIPIQNYLGYAVQAEWTGTPTGTFTLQGSCDAGVILNNGTVTNVTNWTTISSTNISASGSAGSLLYNMPNSYYYWFQLVYTATSGTGTANAAAVIKG